MCNLSLAPPLLERDEVQNKPVNNGRYYEGKPYSKEENETKITTVLCTTNDDWNRLIMPDTGDCGRNKQDGDNAITLCLEPADI